MELDRAIQKRHSVRKFKSKKPDWRNIIECIDAARYAPMAGNNNTVRFILVDDEEKINAIAEACQQDFIAEAKYVAVVCSNPSRTIISYGKRGKVYCRQQAGAAIQNFLLKIEEFGLGACWVGSFIEEQIKRELKIPSDSNVEAVIPIGYEFEKPQRTKKMKAELDSILFFNEFDHKKMQKVKERVY